MSLRGTTLLLLILILTGCSGLSPWVKPSEREFLADPIMSFNRDPIAKGVLLHTYESREAAHGAEGGAGGGCGCN